MVQVFSWLAGLVALAGCASLPADEAAGTPGARVAAQSLASIRAHDATVGAGVAISDGVVLTNAHVVRQGGSRLTLRSADGLREAPADVISIDQRQDLAPLRVRQGFLEPAPVASRRPQHGKAVWALGPEGLGRAVAMGPVTRSDATLPGFGRGFTARLGALMGFSGDPVVNQGGEVVGLTTARIGTGGAGLLGSLTGIDLAGLANPMGREVFVLRLPPGDYAGLR